MEVVTMQIGDEIKVRIVEKTNDKKYKVVTHDDCYSGTLLVKGKLKIKKDGLINAWVLQKTKYGIICGNAYFGKFDISVGLSERYVRIIKDLYNSPRQVTHEDISILKGMVNRCLKQDQWDWYTTYKYLGYPLYRYMHCFINDSIKVRNELRVDDYSNLVWFREKYENWFNSISYFLGEKIYLDEDEIDIPTENIPENLWERLSYESKKNIKMISLLQKKVSNYILMHYFVTLENEYYNHFLLNFIEINRRYNTGYSGNKYKRISDILTGQSKFSLGTIPFFSYYVNNDKAMSSCKSIDDFTKYLGTKCDAFKEISCIIRDTIVEDVTLIDIRNGLAHGDKDILDKINEDTFVQVNRILFKEPYMVIPRILENTMNK